MPNSTTTLKMSFSSRSRLPSTSPLASYLLHLMTIKSSNLCVSADVTTTSELLALAEEVGDSICMLKTHADIISDFSDRTVRQLKEIAQRRMFLLFEDREIWRHWKYEQQVNLVSDLSLTHFHRYGTKAVHRRRLFHCQVGRNNNSPRVPRSCYRHGTQASR
jgi:hypothetical protein